MISCSLRASNLVLFAVSFHARYCALAHYYLCQYLRRLAEESCIYIWHFNFRERVKNGRKWSNSKQRINVIHGFSV